MNNDKLDEIAKTYALLLLSHFECGYSAVEWLIHAQPVFRRAIDEATSPLREQINGLNYCIDKREEEIADLRRQLAIEKDAARIALNLTESAQNDRESLRRQLEAAKEERRRLRGIITDWQKQWSEFEPKLLQAEAELAKLRHEAGIH